MRLNRTYFISEPTEKGELYEFKIDGCDLQFYCNAFSANVRKIINKILDRVQDEELLNLIYEYGEARVEETRESMYD